ncbi:MAG: hypothetical protein JW804_08635 [Sedimentisphaerales bacterium]|nr:hypothetical protein [Sedimentisphaerales bacterium]
MNQVDADAQVMSEDKDDGEETVDNLRLVPVAESIRYRKRAQQSERKVEELTEQLKETKRKAEELSGYAKQLEGEQRLTRKLVDAGASDLEAALLMAKKRSAEKKDADLDEIVEQLKAEKTYLFGLAEAGHSSERVTRTTPAKDRLDTGRSSLEKAAKRAAMSGSSRDLQEYLKLRRNFL